MLIPYKVKNPPRVFPAVTVALIVANAVAYVLTTQGGMHIRMDVVDSYALRWGESSLLTLFTSVFLHADIFHLAGNMLFLWVFGPAVEGRAGRTLYALLYLLAGFAGHVAQAALGAAGAIGQAVPCIGASGCVMGVMGAYLYLYSWSRVCVFYWFGLLVAGTFEIAAVWIIGVYFSLDLLHGFLARSMGTVSGVASFAHVGGAIAGAVLVAGLGFKRDSSEVSQVKATQADMGDISLLNLDELDKLLDHTSEDAALRTDYVAMCVRQRDAERLRRLILRDVRAFVTSHPEAAVDYLVRLGGSPEVFAASDLLYLGRLHEGRSKPNDAIHIYELVESLHRGQPEREMALYRCATVCWRYLHNGHKAQEKLLEQVRDYSSGPLRLEAEDLLAEIALRQGDVRDMAA